MDPKLVLEIMGGLGSLAIILYKLGVIHGEIKRVLEYHERRLDHLEERTSEHGVDIARVKAVVNL